MLSISILLILLGFLTEAQAVGVISVDITQPTTGNNLQNTPLAVSFGGDLAVDFWTYSLNGGATMDGCSPQPEETFNRVMGTLDSAFPLSQGSAAKITFDMLPTNSETLSAEFCVSLWDNAWDEEDHPVTVEISANGVTRTESIDDADIPSGFWTESCFDLVAGEFATTYTFTLTSEAASTAGMSVGIGLSGTLGTSSVQPAGGVWEASPGVYSSMNVVKAATVCPTDTDSVDMDPAMGTNELTVTATAADGTEGSTSLTFSQVGVTNTAITQHLVEVGDSVEISVDVFAADVTSVSMAITTTGGDSYDFTLTATGTVLTGGGETYTGTFTPSPGPHDVVLTVVTSGMTFSGTADVVVDEPYVPLVSIASPSASVVEGGSNLEFTASGVSSITGYDVLVNGESLATCTRVSAATSAPVQYGGTSGGFLRLLDNVVRIEFPEEFVPVHTGGTFCIDVYDESWAEDFGSGDALQPYIHFRVNGNEHLVPDDTSFPSGAWSKACIDLNEEDIATSYFIDVEFEPGAVYGMTLRMDVFPSGMYSYIRGSGASEWIPVQGNMMCDFTFTTAPVECDLSTSLPLSTWGPAMISVTAHNHEHSSAPASVAVFIKGVTGIVTTTQAYLAGDNAVVSAEVMVDPAATSIVVAGTFTGPDDPIVVTMTPGEAGPNGGVMYAAAFVPSAQGTYAAEVVVTSEGAPYTSATGSIVIAELFYGAVALTSFSEGERVTFARSLSFEITGVATVESWQYTLNDVTTVGCQQLPGVSEEFRIGGAEWYLVDLVGSQQVKVSYTADVVPAVHTGARICFNVMDYDWEQEFGLYLLINDNPTPYFIADDMDLPSGVFSDVCFDVAEEDLAESYTAVLYADPSDPQGFKLDTAAFPGSSYSWVTSGGGEWISPNGNVNAFISFDIPPMSCGAVNNDVEVASQAGLNTLELTVFADAHVMVRTVSYHVADIDNMRVSAQPVRGDDTATLTVDVYETDVDGVTGVVTCPGFSAIPLTFSAGADLDRAGKAYDATFLAPTFGECSLDITASRSVGDALLAAGVVTVVLPFTINVDSPLARGNEAGVDLIMDIGNVVDYELWDYTLNGVTEIGCHDEPATTVESVLGTYPVPTMATPSSVHVGGGAAAEIRFGSTEVPPMEEQLAVTFCFSIYDRDYTIEEALHVAVNGDRVVVITDDDSIPAGNWVDRCIDILPEELASEYMFTFTYTGEVGVYMALAPMPVEVRSFTRPVPEADWQVAWNGMNIACKITVDIKTFNCPFDSVTDLATRYGENQLEIVVQGEDGGTFAHVVDFQVIGIDFARVSKHPEFDGDFSQLTFSVFIDNLVSVDVEVIPSSGEAHAVTLYPASGTVVANGGLEFTFDVPTTVETLGYHTVAFTVTADTVLTHQETLDIHNQILRIDTPAIIATKKHAIDLKMPHFAEELYLTVNDAAPELICEYHAPGQTSIDYTNMVMKFPFKIQLDVDLRTDFPKELIPVGKPTRVQVCFYLYDDDPTVEDELLFRVNGGEKIYAIPDDHTIPAYEWIWACKDLDEEDYTPEGYSVSFYYSTRGESGLFIGNDDSEEGVHSFWDVTTPNQGVLTMPHEVFWHSYVDNLDWMVRLVVDTETFFCPINQLVPVSLRTGDNVISVSSSLIAPGPGEDAPPDLADVVHVEVVDLETFPAIPRSAKIGVPITITARPSATTVSSMTAIVGSDYSEDRFPIVLHDDGAHFDGAAGDGVYGNQFTPPVEMPYWADVKLTSEYTTTDEFGTETLGAAERVERVVFQCHHTRVAVMHSQTTLDVWADNIVPMCPVVSDDPLYTEDKCDWYSQWRKGDNVEYNAWSTSLQNELMLAGLPFDLLPESSLLDINEISQYDALVFSHFRHVTPEHRVLYLDTITQAQAMGIGVFGLGEFMTTDHTNTSFADPDMPMNTVFNAKIVGEPSPYFGGLVPGPDAHPTNDRYDIPTSNSARRNPELLTRAELSTVLTADVAAVDTSVPTKTIYQYYDGYTYRDVAIATARGPSRIVYCSDPTAMANSMMARDVMPWVLHGDGPRFGVAWTNASAVFTTRVDADITYNTEVTLTTIPIYRDVMERNNLLGGWYVVNKHSYRMQAQWDTLRLSYEAMMEAGHELGSHSYSHPANMNKLAPETVRFEMGVSKEEIDAEFGVSIEGLCNPGISPKKQILWDIAQEVGYTYYSGLEEEQYKALGYNLPDNEMVNFQQNMEADFSCLYDMKLSHLECADLWIREFDELRKHGDGVIAFAIWHEYSMDDDPDGPAMFGNFADHVGSFDDVISKTPLQITKDFKLWRKQDFHVAEEAVSHNGMKYTMTRITPDAQYGRLQYEARTGFKLWLYGAEGALTRSHDGRAWKWWFGESDVAHIVECQDNTQGHYMGITCDQCQPGWDGSKCDVAVSCSDGKQNQGETGIDCGGPCNVCTGGNVYLGWTADEKEEFASMEEKNAANQKAVTTSYTFVGILAATNVLTIAFFLIRRKFKKKSSVTAYDPDQEVEMEKARTARSSSFAVSMASGQSQRRLVDDAPDDEEEPAYVAKPRAMMPDLVHLPIANPGAVNVSFGNASFGNRGYQSVSNKSESAASVDESSNEGSSRF